jgi:hypothetical protein
MRSCPRQLLTQMTTNEFCFTEIVFSAIPSISLQGAHSHILLQPLLGRRVGPRFFCSLRLLCTYGWVLVLDCWALMESLHP